MGEEFDPYYKWLSIPPREQPPHHYRLLGIAAFEDDVEVIEQAADRQMMHVKMQAAGPRSALSQQILNELAQAKVCLLTPAKKQQYDAALREKLGPAAAPRKVVKKPRAPQPAPQPAATAATQPAAAPATEPSSVRASWLPDGPNLSASPAPVTSRARAARRVNWQPWAVLASVAMIGAAVAIVAYDQLGLRPVPVEVVESPGPNLTESDPPVTPPVAETPAEPVEEEDGPVAPTDEPERTTKTPAAPSSLDPAIREAFAALAAQAEQSGNIEPTRVVGAGDETTLRQYKRPNYLVGMQVSVDLAANEIVALDGVFAGGTVLLSGAEVAAAKRQLVLGSADDALAGIEVAHDDQAIRGVRLFFAKISEEGLDLHQVKASPWIGSSEGEIERLGVSAAPLIGWASNVGSLRRVALLQVGSGTTPAEQPLIAPEEQAKIRAKLRVEMNANKFLKSEVIHKSAAPLKESRPPAYDFATGLDVVLDPATFHVVGVRTVYGQTPGAPALGRTSGAIVPIRAKEGFAIGALEVENGGSIEGLRAIFMAIGPKGLDPKKTYQSPWVGLRRKGSVIRLTTDGAFLVGLAGQGEEELVSLGLLAVDIGQAPEPDDVPAPTPDPDDEEAPEIVEEPLPRPVPDAAALAKANRDLNDIYAEKLREAQRTPRGKSALGNEMFQAGLQTRDDPAGRYALMVEGARLACESRLFVDRSWAMLDEIERQFAVSMLETRVDFLQHLDQIAKSPGDYRALAQSWQRVANDSLKQEDFAQMNTAITRALSAARRSRDNNLESQLKGWNASLKALKEAGDRVKTARVALQADPDDAEAALQVGRFTCAIKQDWTQGLPILARGADEKLSQLAEADQKGTDDNALTLGDEWWDQAQTEKDAYFKVGFQRRAAHWYSRALPSITGLTRAKAEKRIEDADMP